LFWKSMGTTFIFALSLPLSLVVRLVISAMLVSIKRGRAFFYSIFFIPHICSIIALTQVWKVLLNYNYGIINEVINGIFGKRVDWLGTQGGFMTAMIFMSVWQSIGFQVVLLTSGLSNIEKTYYEAASLDGASPFVCFLRITVPQISPIIFYLFVTGMIGSLQEFTRMQSITAGVMGPNQCAVTMVYYLYNMGFNYTFSFGMGYATACAWIIASIIFVVSVVNFKYVQKLVSYD
ncbi:MAG: sugar ABC transporter permease, partial [Clostridia bacterium]|nr:sugar ABC transporter permease [Clostridia bacterium]